MIQPVPDRDVLLGALTVQLNLLTAESLATARSEWERDRSRSLGEVLLARGRTIEREQWTEIDRALKRRAGVDGVVSYENFEPCSEGARVRAGQEIERLSFLEKLGLARRVGERSWELSPEHEQELRRRQREHDIIKTRAREQQRERNNDLDLER